MGRVSQFQSSPLGSVIACFACCLAAKGSDLLYTEKCMRFWRPVRPRGGFISLSIARVISLNRYHHRCNNRTHDRFLD
eukprot:2947063-Pyramimonas_sp.AAC.1